MKKIISLSLSMLLMLSVVCAQEVESEVQAGVSPDSIFYGIDVWWDDMRVSSANSVAEKARLRIEIAEERAAEMEVMGKLNKLTEMARARTEQQTQIQAMEQHIEEIEDDETKVSLQQKFQKHIMNLKRVREQVPEQAKQGLDNAITNANEAFERNQNRITTQNRESVSEITEKIQQGVVKIQSLQSSFKAKEE